METLETIRLTSLQQGEWVTSVVFQGYLLPYTITGTVQEISDFMSRVGHTYSKLTVHCNNKEVKLMAM